MNVCTTIVLTLVFILSILPTRAFGAPSGAQVNDLASQTQADGTMRVVVSLQMPLQPAGVLTAAQAERVQRDNVAQSQRRVLRDLAGQRITVTRQFSVVPALAVTTDAAGLAALQASPNVASIEPDSVVLPTLAQSVPLIGAPQAWAAGYSGAGQTIAILDTGVDETQPFLAGKVVAEACYSDNLCPDGQTEQLGTGAAMPCTAFYDCDHGTHIAGITSGHNALISGVAKDAHIIAVQVLSDKSSQLGANWSDLIRGLEHVYDLRNTYKIAAVNISLASNDVYNSGAACDAKYPAMKQAIDLLRSAGIATIIAAGNSGSNDGISAPACISSAISVGATTKADALWDMSNSAANLSLLAPGVAITSCAPGSTFMTLSGTSMAAPHVAGAWAILKSKMPNLTVDQGLAVLRATGAPITNTRNSIVTPRIRVDAAIAALPANTVQHVVAVNAVYLPLVEN